MLPKINPRAIGTALISQCVTTLLSPFKGKKLSREDTLKSLFNTKGFGLEIGASHNPLLPKANGYNVKTVDYAARSELFEKYSGIQGVDASRIEEVDFVTAGTPMLEVISNRNEFDFIVASHVIEHVPNLIEANHCRLVHT